MKAGSWVPLVKITHVTKFQEMTVVETENQLNPLKLLNDAQVNDANCGASSSFVETIKLLSYSSIIECASKRCSFSTNAYIMIN